MASKQETPKAEAPKAEAPKAEAPKAVSSNPGEVTPVKPKEPTVEKVNGTTIRSY